MYSFRSSYEFDERLTSSWLTAADDQPAAGVHMHLQSCAICQKKSIMKDGRRQHLRMCPCAEAFYCGFVAASV